MTDFEKSLEISRMVDLGKFFEILIIDLGKSLEISRMADLGNPWIVLEMISK